MIGIDRYPAEFNFKRLLLSRVRRLEMTLHNPFICHMEPSHAEAFTNLEVLTITPPRCRFFNAIPGICEDDNFFLRVIEDEGEACENCDFTSRLQPRHIVYRNLGRNGLPVFFPPDEPQPNLKSVTYILPTDAYLAPASMENRGTEADAGTPESSPTILEEDIAGSFPTCPSIRIVFLEDRHMPQDYLFDGMGLEDYVRRDLMGEEEDDDEAPEWLVLRHPKYIPEPHFVRFMRAILCRKEVQYEVCAMEHARVGPARKRTARLADSAIWKRVKESIIRDLKISQDNVKFVELEDYVEECADWEIDEDEKREAERLIRYSCECLKSGRALMTVDGEADTSDSEAEFDWGDIGAEDDLYALMMGIIRILENDRMMTVMISCMAIRWGIRIIGIYE